MRWAAKASECELSSAVEAAGLVADDVADLRPPELGMVMMRGRIGSTGCAFNVGEVTVTRSVVSLATGEVGYSYLLGYCPAKARAAAILDGLAQRAASDARLAETLTRAFIEPVQARYLAERERLDAETAKTRVNFFTVVRGED
ncbi:MAG: phosphonate C-P lyase system protein PhnG [Hyphomicrobiaceae bacterium]